MQQESAKVTMSEVLDCSRWLTTGQQHAPAPDMPQAHVWNVLPQDVVRSVLDRLSFKDAMRCRSLSRSWAAAVQASVPVEVVIPAKRQNLSAKVRRLQQIASQSSQAALGQRRYTFQLTEPSLVTDCSSLLKCLTKQGRVAAPYQVLIQLLTAEPSSLHKIRQALATIVETTTQLASNNVKVFIALSIGKFGSLPSPDVLAMLAPIIQRLDCAPVDATSEARDVLSDGHIAALLPGISHILRLSLARRHGSGSFFALLAKFGNLQQLELHLEDAAGLNHLSVLKGLLEFHLTVTDERQSDIRCDDVLDSNRDSLMHVALTAESWDDQTYMALMRLSKLRTISLQVGQLRQVNAQALAQLRPSQTMSVTIKKASRLPGVVLHEMTSCDVHITDLTLADSAMVVSWLRTMQHLTSLTLVVTDLTSGVCMSNTQLEGIVQICPSIQHLSLIKCLQFSSDTLRIILRLQHLHTLCLAHVPGLSAATVRWIEAVIRSQQCIGMAQPQIHVICKWGGHVRELCVDCMRYPVLCGTDFDEQRATFAQKSWAKVGYPSSRALGRGCMSLASMLQGLPGRAKLYAHAVANSGSWEQFEKQHPLGLLIVVAMIGIHVACLYMPVSEPNDIDLRNGDDGADLSGDANLTQDNASTVPANNVADLDADIHPVPGYEGYCSD